MNGALCWTTPRSVPAAPATTISGSRCSSRGWAARAAGAALHAASARRASRARRSPRRAARRRTARRRWRARIAPKRAQVVEAHAAADDEDALVAQRCERAADREVLPPDRGRAQRELHRRDVRVGVGELERNERAVIVAARGVGRGRECRPRRAARARAPRGRVARSGPGDLVRLGREAVVVVEDRRLLGRHHRRHALFPVRGDHEQRLGCGQLGSAERRAGSRPGRRRLWRRQAQVDERPGSAAMGDEDDRHAHTEHNGAATGASEGADRELAVAQCSRERSEPAGPRDGGRIDGAYLAAQAEAIWPQEEPLVRRYAPRDVLDVGCGTGEFSSRPRRCFRRRGSPASI